MRFLRAWFWVGALGLLTGCSLTSKITGGSIKLESRSMSVEKPAQIAVFMTAATSKAPLVDLIPSNFEIYEDGQLLDPQTIGQTLLDPDQVAHFHTLLLVDMSGDASSDSNKPVIEKAVVNFVERTRRMQAVSVYAFDGSDEIHRIADFPQQKNAPPPAGIPELAAFTARDESRNFRGAVVEGLKQLNVHLNENDKPLHVGTLVVFTQGPDLAKRVGEEDFYGAVDSTRRSIFVMHLPPLEKRLDSEIRFAGQDGLMEVDSMANLPIAMESASITLADHKRKHYVLSYCSPARQGPRSLRIKLVAIDPDGVERKGNLVEEFDSAGFGPGCDAEAIPFGAGEGATADRPGGATPATPPEGDSAEERDVIVPPPDSPTYQP